MNKGPISIKYDLTNREVIDIVAPATGNKPDNLVHVVLIWLTKDGYIGGRSTECPTHAQELCEMAKSLVFSIPVKARDHL